MARGPVGPTEILAVTIHRPDGVLDLVAPAAAPGNDAAREYAAQAGLADVAEGLCLAFRAGVGAVLHRSLPAPVGTAVVMFGTPVLG